MLLLVPLAVITLIAATFTNCGALIIRATAFAVVSPVVVAVVSFIVLFAPLSLEVLVARNLNRPHVWFYDLRLPILLVPVSVAVLVSWPLARAHRPTRARVAVGLWAWVAFAGVLNTVNKCSPGWCGSYGFPVPFYSWSDAVISFNGETPQPFIPGALVFDALVVIAPFLVISLREVTHRLTKAPSNSG